MPEYGWNNVIWSAINELKYLYYKDNARFCIDDFFCKVRKKLLLLEAPEREIELRLFALALYCSKNYHKEFLKSAVFTRFGATLDIRHFEEIVKKLIEENSFALVVYWVVLRCSFANTLPQHVYLPLDSEIKQALLAL